MVPWSIWYLHKHQKEDTTPYTWSWSTMINIRITNSHSCRCQMTHHFFFFPFTWTPKCNIIMSKGTLKKYTKDQVWDGCTWLVNKTNSSNLYKKVGDSHQCSDWSPHMSFILKGSQISALQLKGWFKPKTSIQEYTNEIQNSY